MLERNLKPVGLRKPGSMGLEIKIGPVWGQSTAQLLSRVDNTLIVIVRGVPAGEHNLGFPVESTQELGLPVVPDPGPNGPNIAHR